MGKLKVAVRIPYAGDFTKRDIIDVMRIADQANFHSAWVADHIVYPAGETDSRNPHAAYPRELMAAPAYEALTVMAFAAAVSERTPIGVGCLVAPQREPLLMAKQVASIDRLSGGRVIFGAVGGWLEDEFKALGMPFDHRGARLEEAIAVMRACWEEDIPSWRGEYYGFDPVFFQPKPAQRPLPVWFGGTEKTLKRAALLGDGFYGSKLSPEQAANACAALTEYRAQGPRAGHPFTTMASIPGKQATTPSEIRDWLAQYQDTGLDVIFLDCDVREGPTFVKVVAAAAEVVG